MRRNERYKRQRTERANEDNHSTAMATQLLFGGPKLLLVGFELMRIFKRQETEIGMMLEAILKLCL
jgi:hypothetical protein